MKRLRIERIHNYFRISCACTENRNQGTRYTEKNISEFFLFFIGILPQGVENRKICYLKGSIHYCESEITG